MLRRGGQPGGSVHELSLAGGILQLVEKAQLEERFVGVESLHIEAGALASVDLHALRFAIEAMARGTVLEGAEIRIDERPGVARCAVCEHDVELWSRADACPRCGSYGLVPTAGTELRIMGLTVHDTAQGGAQ
jgi:hydrogenase nickel incorporation protein HypA/HybF